MCATGRARPGKRPAILTHEEWKRNLPAAPRRAVARMLRALWLALCLAAPCGPVTAAEPLVLLVQPPPWPGDVRAFDPAPLAALIAGALQRPVQVLQPADALSHWRAVRRPDRNPKR